MGLTVVPTPIGNLADITLRALDALREAEVVACEDTRRTRVLLSAHGIRAPRLVLCNEHEEARRTPELVALAADHPVALVTDAGMPAIADPGRTLVRAALEAGVELTVLPGPGSVETALVRSGLSADGYVFRGWVPRRAADRRRVLAEAGRSPLPVVLFESPRRVAATLRELGDAEVAVCRELTKIHETVLRGPAADLAETVEPRGEIVLVVAAARAAPVAEEEAERVAAELREAGLTPSRAAAVAARLTGRPRRSLYATSASRATSASLRSSRQDAHTS
jgi:16S rRNA (cytidine1402-2'-O)-methyltransferase